MSETEAANTAIFWIGITTLLIAVPCFIAHYIKMRRFYSKFNRKNERQLYSVGSRFDFTRDQK